jgi:hypothetical protein
VTRALARRYGRARRETLGWGSREAEDLFKIATRLAGFDARALMLEITRRQRGRDSKANAATVLAAMQTLSDKFDREHPTDPSVIAHQARRAEAFQRLMR